MCLFPFYFGLSADTRLKHREHPGNTLWLTQTLAVLELHTTTEPSFSPRPKERSNFVQHPSASQGQSALKHAAHLLCCQSLQDPVEEKKKPLKMTQGTVLSVLWPVWPWVNLSKHVTVQYQRNLWNSVGGQFAAAFSFQRLSSWEILGHREVGGIAEGHQTRERMTEDTTAGSYRDAGSPCPDRDDGDGWNLVVTLWVLFSFTLLHPYSTLLTPQH